MVIQGLFQCGQGRNFQRKGSFCDGEKVGIGHILHSGCGQKYDVAIDCIAYHKKRAKIATQFRITLALDKKSGKEDQANGQHKPIIAVKNLSGKTAWGN